MSLWSRLLGRETRSLESPFLPSLLHGNLIAGDRYVSTTLAQNLSAVTACVDAIASAMSSLPPLLYRVDNEGRTEVRGHWANRLLSRPNRRQTWADLIEFVMGDVLLRGNALLQIETDNAGRPVALIPIPWRNVLVEQLANGRLVYVATRPAAPWATVQPPVRLLDDSVFHLKDRSDDGFLGRSRISRAPDVITNAALLQDYSVSTWRNAATPSGAVEVEGALTQPMFERLKTQFEERFTGTRNARKVLILDNRTTWKSLSVSPEDAEVLNSRRYSLEELARLWGVPPLIIGDLSHGTFTNSETLIRYFAQQTLSYWCNKFALEFGRTVLGANNSDMEIELDLSALLRGDPATRWATYDIAVKNGILTTDEIREAEGYNPRPAGDSAPVIG